MSRSTRLKAGGWGKAYDKDTEAESGDDSSHKSIMRRMSSSVIKEAKQFRHGLSMKGGDWGALTQLFFDNLSTLLGALFAIQAMVNFGVSEEAVSYVVFKKIVPGVGLTLFIGNVYYTWMAIRLTNKYNRPYTAQPYGLNTPAAFAFVFNIMYPVYFGSSQATPDEKFYEAYQVALVANFLTGVISAVLALFGPLILKVVPPAALLVPIAGIGIAFLGLEQTAYSIAAPIVGYSCLAWVYLGWYAKVRIGYGKWRCPEALQIILIGVILGWATGLNDPETLKSAAGLVRWLGPDWSGDELFSNFGIIANYLGIVIPIGISATATTLMCLVSAKTAGDPYPVRESMIADGIGTMIASFFGSPFGTVIYIGHPAYKKSGARAGYSLANGLIFLIFSWFGILALMQAIVNQATIGPIVLFVGLMINEEALNFIPARHYAAYIIGLFPSIYDWTVNVAGRSPLGGPPDGNTNLDGTLTNWYGVLAWKRGAILVSMVWVAMAVMMIDRKWKLATIWALVGAFFAAFGIIHMPEAGFDNFSTPFWEQCNASTLTCWEFGKQWMYMVAYVMLAATFALIELARRCGDKTMLPPIDDIHEKSLTSDWFAEAEGGGGNDEGEYKTPHRNIEGSAPAESTPHREISPDDIDPEAPADEEQAAASDSDEDPVKNEE